MCAKFTQVVSNILPEGPIKEGLRSSYYLLYYNAKHFKENEFRLYYKDGHFEYAFENNIRFKSYENMADELKRSLKGYLARHPLTEGQRVVDCGAYIGEFALYAASVVGSEGRVIAFEPDPVIFEKLLKNIELNGFNNIVALNKGVWSKSGVLKFVGDQLKGYSFMSADSDQDAIKVPVVTLDEELERIDLKNVDFIKMDVEGAEIEAINGAGKTLTVIKPDLAIASYHKIDGKKSCYELEKILPALGYKTHTGHQRHLTTYANKI